METRVATFDVERPKDRLRLWTAVALLAAVPGIGYGAQCGTLKQAASINLIPALNGVQMVPVIINGTQKNLLLSTAGGISALSARTVAAFGLHPVSTARGGRLLDRAGNASNLYVVVASFELGGLQGKNVYFMVSPNQKMGTNAALPIDGVLANDMMDRFDVEMDFANHKLNYFSTDHCDGDVVYWPANATAIVSYSSAKPGARIPDSHIRIPVTLDGKEFKALIDTGSPRSTISAATAEYVFHITANTPGAVPLGTVANDPNHRILGYEFGNLAFEGVSVSHPRFAVIPDLVGSKDPSNEFKTGSRVQKVDDHIGPEITIGMDVLRELHLYVATREHRLYITPSTPAVAPSP